MPTGYRMTVAYDGRAFHGWQVQPRMRTVQGVMQEELRVIAGAHVELRAAGRTDAGVHALGQAVAFDSPRELPPLGWIRALNGRLPDDVSVRDIVETELGYDPRYDAMSKTYRYLFHVAATPNPLWQDRAWHLGPRRARPWTPGSGRTTFRDWLDVDAMRRAAAALEGEHDFHAFRAAHDDRENTMRTLFSVKLHEGFGGDEEILALEIQGTAFMRNMVRILAGTLVEVGRERMTHPELEALLRPTASRSDAGETAPAGGLYLVEVKLGRRRAEAEAEARTGDASPTGASR